MKKMRKLLVIIIVFIVAIVFEVQTSKIVSAETCTNKFKQNGTSFAIGDQFKIIIECDNDDNCTISRNYENANGPKYENIKFQIVDSYPEGSVMNSDEFTLEEGKKQAIKINKRFEKFTDFKNLPEDFSKEDNDFRNSLTQLSNFAVIKMKADFSDKTCTGDVTVYVAHGKSPKRISIIDEGTKGKSTNFNENTSSESFVEKITQAKEKAKKQGNVYGGEGFTIDSVRDEVSKDFKKRTFQCDPNLKKTSKEIIFKFDADLGNEENYYLEENTKYLYASADQQIDVGTYTYHLTNKKTKTETISCNVSCEEAVEVRYGPPVASKAGLCFEYKVRVESRVNCNASSSESGMKEPDVPGVCTPAPECYGNNTYYLQGGPNEEFDQCISNCDGGKYTEKCSDKCYKQVYKNKKFSKNRLNAFLENSKAKLLAAKEESWEDIAYNYNYNTFVVAEHNHNGSTCYNVRAGGYYYVKDNGNIDYYTGADEYTDPTQHWSVWHVRNNNWGAYGPYCDRQTSGIPRHMSCSDRCYWKNDCLDGDYYLNKGNQVYDIKKNGAVYESAKTECQAYNKCSTSVATFKISVDYKKEGATEGTTTNKTIEFPYNTKEDSLSSAKTKSGNTCDINTSAKNTYNENNTTLNSLLIKNYEQCYGEGDKCPPDHYYLSEWSFPGSYINKKTGEISYAYKSDDDSTWRAKKTKFCIPRDAQSVNVLWYQWYMHTVEGISASNDEECLTSDEKKATEQKDYKSSDYSGDKGDIEYNINAETTNFGFFNWSIKMQCFYAIYTNNSTEKSDSITCGTDQRTRTVSNEELFPSTRGAAKEPSTTYTEGDYKRGFNWTEKAQLTTTMVTEEGNDYIVNPDTVRAQIKKKGNSIYNSDSYVDYYFKLSTSNLTDIKKFNSDRKFGIYTGDYIESDGYTDKSTGEKVTIVHYMSDLFRDSSINFESKSIPTTKGLKCNNILSTESCGQD